jgi:hypothetical protein
MKNILIAFSLVLTVLLTPSCGRKSGCPAETAQTKVGKDGEYKAGKAKSGLLPKKAYKKK